MPFRIDPADKPIFSASVVADMVGIHPRTLRIYEEQGLIHPARGSGDERLYSERDVQRIRIVRDLTQVLGVEMTAVKVILGMVDEVELRHLPGEEILKKVIERMRPVR